MEFPRRDRRFRFVSPPSGEKSATELLSRARTFSLERDCSGDTLLTRLLFNERLVRLVAYSSPVRFVIPALSALNWLNLSRSTLFKRPAGLLIKTRMAVSRFGSGTE